MFEILIVFQLLRRDAKETDTVTASGTSGKYFRMKPDGRALSMRLRRDFPLGHQLATSSVKPRVFLQGSDGEIVLEKFADVVTPQVQERIEELWDEMVDNGLVLGSLKSEKNRASQSSLHLGIWEKFRLDPIVTTETWKKQNPTVRELIAELLTVISEEVAPRMVSLLKVYHPEVWARQEE